MTLLLQTIYDSLFRVPFWDINLHRFGVIAVTTILVIVFFRIWLLRDRKNYLLLAMTAVILGGDLWLITGWILTLGLVLGGPEWLAMWFGLLGHPVLATWGASLTWLWWLLVGRDWLKRLVNKL